MKTSIVVSRNRLYFALAVLCALFVFHHSLLVVSPQQNGLKCQTESKVVSMTNVSREGNYIVPSTISNYLKGAVVPKLASIPITAYNACQDRIQHLSCMLTIITPSSKIPSIPELYDDLCDYTLNEMDVKVADNAHIDVCIQEVDGTVSGIVYPARNNDDSSSPLKVSSMLKVDEVDSILPSLVKNVSETRKVHRSVIAAHLAQYIRSKQHEIERGDDGNFGNFIWEYGVSRLYNPFTTVAIDLLEYQRDWPEKKDLGLKMFGQDPKMTLYGVSTLFYIGKKQGVQKESDEYNRYMALFTRTVDLPALMIGAGIHVKPEDGVSLEKLMHNDLMGDSHKELMTAMEEHTKGSYSVVVRGDITEAFVRNANFTNALSLGCPSLTINRSFNLGHDFALKWERTISKLRKKENIRIGLAFPVNKDLTPHQQDQLRSSFRKIYDTNLDVYFICQTPQDEENALGIAHKTHVRSFINVEDWRDFTSTLDIMISLRIHGGMANIASGTPAIVIPTDYRIQELVEAMKIPTLSLNQLLEADPEDLIGILELVKPDFDEFESNRREKIAAYLKLLTTYGIEMDPQLLAIHEMAKKEV